MKIEIPLEIPEIGDVENIELVSWNIQEGDMVQEGEEICELVTDKVTFSVEAPKAGTISKIYKKQKSFVKVGEKIAILEVA